MMKVKLTMMQVAMLATLFMTTSYPGFALADTSPTPSISPSPSESPSASMVSPSPSSSASKTVSGTAEPTGSPSMTASSTAGASMATPSASGSPSPSEASMSGSPSSTPLATKGGTPTPTSVLSEQKIKFYNRLKYDEDDREGECVSMDFTNLTDHVFILAVRPTGGPLHVDKAATIKSITRPKDAEDWYCVNFEDSLNQFDYEHVWIKQDESHAVLASDCYGSEPLSMYQSETQNAMCGEIPESFREPGFRFEDPNDNCAYVDFDNNNPNEGGSLHEFCRYSWGANTCYNGAPISKINSFLGEDNAWTCMAFEPSDSMSLELWMNPNMGSDGEVSLELNPGSPPCQDSNVPSSSKKITPGERCPQLPVDEEKHFTQDNFCHSFDFSKSVFPGSVFRYCRDTNETLSKCLPADVMDIHKITNTSDDSVLYCTHFQWGEDKDNKFLWLKDMGGVVSAAVNDIGCEAREDVPSEFHDLSEDRCEGLPDKARTYIKFNDFEGTCRSFNFTNNPPAGGSAASRKQYSVFEYCRNGGQVNTNEGGADRTCDLSATVETIQMINENWYCLKFSSSAVQDGNDHLWIQKDAEKAVMSSDCNGDPLLDFRDSDTVLTTDPADGMCHVLPAALRKEHLFWSQDVCASVDFTGPLYEQNAINVYDYFVYCRGVGGRRHCTLPRDSMPDSNNASTILDFKETGSWFCVKFSVPDYMPGEPSTRGLWMKSDASYAAFADTVDGNNDCSGVPPNEGNPLNEGECPVLPEITWKETKVYQGEGACASVDFTNHPGRDSQGEDSFEFCLTNGHCNHAVLKNLSKRADNNLCVLFEYTSSYGLENEERAFAISPDGSSGALAVSCSSVGGLVDVHEGMCQRLPGEMQKKFFFLQDGTQATFNFYYNPTEEQRHFQFCKNYRHNTYCDDMATIHSVINPDPYGNKNEDKNWYCISFTYDTGYGLEQEEFLWLNPHYYGWDEGIGVLDKDCTAPPSIPSPGQGDSVIRDLEAPSPSPSVSPSAEPTMPTPSAMPTSATPSTTASAARTPSVTASATTIPGRGSEPGEVTRNKIEPANVCNLPATPDYGPLSHLPNGIEGDSQPYVVLGVAGDDGYFLLTPAEGSSDCGENQEEIRCDGGLCTDNTQTNMGKSVDALTREEGGNKHTYIAGVALQNPGRLLVSRDFEEDNRPTTAVQEQLDECSLHNGIKLFGQDTNGNPFIAVTWSCPTKNMTTFVTVPDSVWTGSFGNANGVMELPYERPMFASSPDKNLMLVFDTTNVTTEGLAEKSVICGTANKVDTPTCSSGFDFATELFTVVDSAVWTDDDFVVVYGRKRTGELVASFTKLRGVPSTVGELPQANISSLWITRPASVDLETVKGAAGLPSENARLLLEEEDTRQNRTFSMVLSGRGKGANSDGAFVQSVDLLVGPAPASPSPSSSPGSSPGSSSSGTSTGVIAGAAVGGVAGLGIIVAIAVAISKKRKGGGEREVSTEMPAANAVKNPSYQTA